MANEGDTGKRNGNGKTARFEALMQMASSGDTWVKLGTLLLVVFSGIGNFVTTERVGELGHRERDRAIREIHNIYDRIDEFEKRWEQSLANQRAIIHSNAEELDSINKLLGNDREILRSIREAQIQFLQRQQRLFPQPPISPELIDTDPPKEHSLLKPPE